MTPALQAVEWDHRRQRRKPYSGTELGGRGARRRRRNAAWRAVLCNVFKGYIYPFTQQQQGATQESKLGVPLSVITEWRR